MTGQRATSTPGAGQASAGAPTRARLAAWVFGTYVAVAWAVVVFALGRYFWFLGDDWDFLSDRRAGSFNDLFRPHAEHWSTLPVLSYRLEWHLFGFHYSAYQALTVALHLAAVVLLRCVMRRAGVDPWISTAAAASVVLFSPGAQNILWSFQIGMVGSLVFGLAHLILAGRDGEIGRADWLGLGAGLAALMCSGLGPVMVGVVGLAVLLKRGWRAAAFHTVPLFVIFAAWFAAYRKDQPATPGHVGLHTLIEWLWQGAGSAFDGLGHYAAVGVILAALLVGGLALAWIPRRAQTSSDVRRRAAEPAALLMGALAFQIVTANSRWAFGTDVARSSRYVHVTALLIVPALAVAFDAIARRWKRALPLLVVLLLASIPGNIAGFNSHRGAFNDRYFTRQRDFVEALASSPLAARIPRSDRPIRDVLGGEGPSVGWLVDAYRDGRLRAPASPEAGLADRVVVRLGLAQAFTGSRASGAGHRCRTYQRAINLDPQRGETFEILTTIGVRRRDAVSPDFFAEPYLLLAGEYLRAEVGGLHLRIQALAPARSFRMCS